VVQLALTLPDIAGLVEEQSITAKPSSSKLASKSGFAPHLVAIKETVVPNGLVRTTTTSQ
jgi:hypothetical protein